MHRKRHVNCHLPCTAPKLSGGFTKSKVYHNAWVPDDKSVTCWWGCTDYVLLSADVMEDLWSLWAIFTMSQRWLKSSIYILMRKSLNTLSTEASATTSNYHVRATARHSGRTAHMCTSESYRWSIRKFVSRWLDQTMALKSCAERTLPSNRFYFMQRKHQPSCDTLFHGHSAEATTVSSSMQHLTSIPQLAISVCFVTLNIRSRRPLRQGWLRCLCRQTVDAARRQHRGRILLPLGNIRFTMHAAR